MTIPKIHLETLDSICLDIIDCPHETPEWKSDGVRIIRNFNIVGSRITDIDPYYVDKKTYEKRTRRAIPQEGDLIISREAPMGPVALVPSYKCCLGQRLVLLKIKSNMYYSKYLLYALQSDCVTKQIKQRDVTGSIVSNLSLPSLKNLQIPVCDYDNQVQIGDFLDNITEKISNNNAIISELEAMAKDIYDYWFVQFDFPDENGKPYKSSGGKMVWNEELKREIPEGWKKSTFCELFNIVMGSSPKGDSINTQEDGIVFYQGNADFGLRFPSPRTYTINPIRYAEKDDVLLSVRAPVGAVNIATERCCIGRGVASLSSNSPNFAYYTIRLSHHSFDIYNQNGTTFGCIGKDALGNIPCICPTETIMKNFESLISPLSKEISNLFSQTTELTSLRDFLLPLLMNGQVKVRTTEA